MYGRGKKSSSSPKIGGAQWMSTVGSTLWGTGDHGAGHAVVLGGILGLAEIAPASLWLLQASWRLLWRVPSSRRGVAMFRGSCRPGSCPGQGQGCFRGPCPCHSRIPRRGKYKRSTGSWQHSGWSSAEHVSHNVAGSHSVATAPEMA